MRKNLWYMVLFLLLLSSCGVSRSLRDRPVLTGLDSTVPVVQQHEGTLRTSGNNFMLQNPQNLWELYVEGDALHRGLTEGALTEHLHKHQEHIFFDRLTEWVPSPSKQKWMGKFIKFYNRKLYRYIPQEYKAEIYGISQYASHEYDDIAPGYVRGLYLHGVHDLGHALQDLAIVGCSSFAIKGDRTDDGGLLLGRNFDFNAGDEFARNKVVSFIKPATGYPFMTVTWAGMIGAVSGMNAQGLTVTINAARSKVPLAARTPISIVTREVLQYAKNIEEAIAIVRKKKVFVSESIMVGSAADNKAVIIEVSPTDIGVYESADTGMLICTNHYQSSEMKDGKRNRYQIKNSHSQYRYDRLMTLLDSSGKIGPVKAAAILRNKEGKNGLALGYGNEKALNQLMAHHSVIFKLAKRLVWVSANPYQMGDYVCYDLNKIFNSGSISTPATTLAEERLIIPGDPFLATQEYKNYELFRIQDRQMDTILKKHSVMPPGFAQNYQSLNPDHWIVYYKVGLYFYRRREYTAAAGHFEKALTKEITTLPAKKKTEQYLKKARSK